LPDSDKALEKVGIFVDVQNIYYTCRQAHNASFDYNKFWAEVTRDREIVCAYAYATDRGDKKQMIGMSALRWTYSRQHRNATPSCSHRAMATSASCLTASESGLIRSPKSMVFER